MFVLLYKTLYLDKSMHFLQGLAYYVHQKCVRTYASATRRCSGSRCEFSVNMAAKRNKRCFRVRCETPSTLILLSAAFCSERRLFRHVLREEVYVKINILQDRHTQTQISVRHSCVSLYVFYGMHPELIQIHPK